MRKNLNLNSAKATPYSTRAFTSLHLRAVLTMFAGLSLSTSPLLYASVGSEHKASERGGLKPHTETSGSSTARSSGTSPDIRDFTKIDHFKIDPMTPRNPNFRSRDNSEKRLDPLRNRITSIPKAHEEVMAPTPPAPEHSGLSLKGPLGVVDQAP